MAKIMFTVIDHSAEVKRLFNEYVQDGLAAIGQEAEGFAKDECPVDTGRLRNSITFATKDVSSSGNDRGKQPADAKEMAKQATPEEYAVYIGTNVRYAVYVEYCNYKHQTGRRHFLRNAAANHRDRYKEIMKAALDR